MEIKTNDEKEEILLHCAWHEDIEDVKRTAERLNINKISSGICSRCLQIIEVKEKERQRLEKCLKKGSISKEAYQDYMQNLDKRAKELLNQLDENT